MIRIALIICLLFLTGCLEVEGRNQTFEEANVQNKLSAIFAKNGQKFWCTQTSYLKCLDISVVECESQHSQFKDFCLSYAKENTPEIANNQDVGDFAIAYGECIKGSYEKENDLSFEAIQCLDLAKIDKNTMLKNVYEVTQ